MFLFVPLFAKIWTAGHLFVLVLKATWAHPHAVVGLTPFARHAVI